MDSIGRLLYRSIFCCAQKQLEWERHVKKKDAEMVCDA